MIEKFQEVKSDKHFARCTQRVCRSRDEIIFPANLDNHISMLFTMVYNRSTSLTGLFFSYFSHSFEGDERREVSSWFSSPTFPHI